MALLQMDGFQYYSTDDQAAQFGTKWNPNLGSFGISSFTGRDGIGYAPSSEANANLMAGFAAAQELIFGFSHFATKSASSRFFTLHHEDWIQVGLHLSSGGLLYCSRGGTTYLGQSTKRINTFMWNHIEVRVKIANSPDGTFEVRVNNEVVMDLTGLDTQNNPSAALMDSVEISGANSSADRINDWYVMDLTGTRLNDFLGDCRIETLHPDGVGAAADFTPSAGANWQNVDEDGNPDEDTTYNEDTVVSSKDRLTHGNLAGAPTTIHAVAVGVCMKKSEAGPRTARAVAYDGVSEGEGADIYPAFGDYAWYQHIFEDHPSGAAVWTASEVDSGEFGYKIQA